MVEGRDRSRHDVFQRERQQRGPYFRSAHPRVALVPCTHARTHSRTYVPYTLFGRLTSLRVVFVSCVWIIQQNYLWSFGTTRSKILNSHAASFPAARARARELLESRRSSYKFIVRVYARRCYYRRCRRRRTHSLKATFSLRTRARAHNT